MDLEMAVPDLNTSDQMMQIQDRLELREAWLTGPAGGDLVERDGRGRDAIPKSSMDKGGRPYLHLAVSWMLGA